MRNRDHLKNVECRWTLIGPAVRKYHKLARCQCGTEREVVFYRNGFNSLSCGCLQKEAIQKSNTKHGGSRRSGDTPEYRAWCHMWGRCNSPKDKRYHRYGARGIKVCDRWSGKEGFKNFLADIGPRPSPKHSLDRIDNDDDYCPENCKWSSDKEQARNRSTNMYIEFQGRTQTLAAWAVELNIQAGTIRNRIKLYNWSVEKALTTPVNQVVNREQQPPIHPITPRS